MIFTIRDSGIITDEAKKFAGVLIGERVYALEEFRDPMKKFFKTGNIELIEAECLEELVRSLGEDK